MMIVCASVNVFVASETNGRPPRADKVVLKMLILVFELRMLLPKSLDHLRVLKSGVKLERVWSGIRIGWRSISVLDSPGYTMRGFISPFLSSIS